MNINEIIHINGRYKKIDCDLLDDTHVLIRIKTGKDINRVKVVFNDPYIRIVQNEKLYWPFQEIDMHLSGETYTNKYFSVILECELHRLKYYFELYDDKEIIQYSESGFTKNCAHNDLAMFFIPYITKSNIFNNPKWIENIVWYQILPERFNYNIRGIIDKLDYLHDMGINGLYINPIYKAVSYHKYDVIDYTIVDDDLGTIEEFEELCEKAHEFDMKIMLDISFTHCSNLNPMFQDILLKKSKSDFYSMFKIKEINDDTLEYECFGMIKSMPKFETESFKTISYFANEVIKKWMKIGVDAWRLDVANEISDTMLSDIKKVVQSFKKETYIVGEIWHNATEWIDNNGLDGVTNYALSRAILSFICDKNHDVLKYRSDIDTIRHNYTLKQLKSSMSLLDSHDTPRIRTIFNDDIDKVKLSLFLLLTFYGTPSLYYGTERFMKGGSDPDNRRRPDWDRISNEGKDLYKIIKKLITIRKENPIIANDGDFEWIDHNELLIIRRYNQENEYYIVVNTKEFLIDTVLPMDRKYINIIDGLEIGSYIKMQRLGFMILKPIDR